MSPFSVYKCPGTVGTGNISYLKDGDSRWVYTRLYGVTSQKPENGNITHCIFKLYIKDDVSETSPCSNHYTLMTNLFWIGGWVGHGIKCTSVHFPSPEER
jgi:hypothetical protein